MKVISNSSPLIGLSSIRKLDILKVVWGSVIIPQAVFHEVVILGENKTGSKAVKAACQDWLEVINIQSIQEVEALQTILDLGESEVITLGQELGADLFAFARIPCSSRSAGACAACAAGMNGGANRVEAR